MPRRAIDQVFEGLSVAAERHLAQRGHRQQAAKRIECLLFQDGIALFKIVLQPFLERMKQSHVRIEQVVHGSGILGEQSVPLQIRLGNVVEVPASDLRPEVNVARRAFDRLESNALVLNELHRHLRDAPNEEMSAGDLRDGIVTVLRQPF